MSVSDFRVDQRALLLDSTIWRSKALRHALAEHIESLISFLDQLDGDADLEPDEEEDQGIDEPREVPAATQGWFTEMPTGGNGLREEPSPPFVLPARVGVVRKATTHRERVRNIVLRHGPEIASDTEVLAAVLSLAVARDGMERLAEELLERFGSMSAVLAAPSSELSRYAGIGLRSAGNLKILLVAVKRFGRDQLPRDKPILSSWTDLLEYLRVTMAFESVEQFRLIFLDVKNRVITDEVHQMGTVNHTPAYPREVVRRSLEVGATAIILVHNHPSGSCDPSAADVQVTKEIIQAAKSVGVVVHDHIIIGSNGHVSLKALRLISPAVRLRITGHAVENNGSQPSSSLPIRAS